MDLDLIRKQFSACECGMEHTLDIRAVDVGSGITANTGD